MGTEEELLRRIRGALANAHLEVDPLVADAWQGARDEVRTVLQRAFQQELLQRVAAAIETAPPAGSSRPAAPQPPAAPPDDGPATATYVFGITRPSAVVDDELPQVPGGGPVRALDHGQVRAVVCDADPTVLRDLEQVAPGSELDILAAAAHAHDEVLARMAAQAPVLPLRLGTLLASDDVARALLEANLETLTAELARVEGHAEWAVVVRIADRDEPEAGPGDGDDGVSYLHGRKAALTARERRWEARERLATDVHDRLARHAVAADTVERRPLEQVPPALHGVYLLRWEAIAAFEDAVAEARAAHPDAVIEATGPWPPYHFTSVTLTAGGGGAS